MSLLRAQVLTVPTMLTLVRLTAVPALVAGWYSSAPWAAGACTALFVGASITDWLDGYLARKMVGSEQCAIVAASGAGRG